MADIENILHNEDDLNNEQLIKYLEGKLSEEERHAIEKQMAASSFTNDAIEGLQSIANKKDINLYVDELNRQLHQYTHKHQKKKSKRAIKHLDWIILSIIIVILLCVLGYYVINLHKQNKQPDKTEIKR